MKSQYRQVSAILMLPLLLVIYSHSINDLKTSGNTKSIVWDANENNMAGYRIPGIVITPNGTVLAFAEERANYADEAPKSLVLKRSIDQGKTWSLNIYIEKSNGEYWSEHFDEIDPRDAQHKKEVWMNTAPIIDAKSGTVFFFYALNEGDVAGQNLQRYTKLFYKSSHDDGLTWSTRNEVTHLLNCKQDGSPNKGKSGVWNTDKNGFPCDFLGRAFHLPGPGHGIQLSDGRLLIPIWSRTALASFNAQSLHPVSKRKYGLRTIYSDDHGVSWKTGKAFGHDGLSMNESRIAELDHGDLYINARYVSNDPKANNHRITGLSKDQGKTWTALQIDKNFALSNPCDAGLISTKNTNHGTTLLYSKNESIEGRKNLVVRLSEDNGTSWPFSRTIDKGEVWYSDMAALSNDKMLVLYETGKGSPVYCTAFNLSWVKGK